MIIVEYQNIKKMKRVINLLFIIIVSLHCLAQSNVPPRYSVNPNATYQLFPTENRWIFIKLNTQTGQMWMVQYSTSSASDALTCSLNSVSLLESSDENVNGRFTLYPTQNHYNFILLDQINGRTWQVQWNTDVYNIGLWEID